MSLLADLRCRVGADISEFSTKMGVVKGEIGGLGGLDKVASAGLIGVAAVIAGVGVVSLKMAENFQASTAQIAINAQIPQKAADDIGKAFLTTAGQSTFSAKAMADAFGPVAGKLGELKGAALSTSESLAIMKVSTDLAEATGQDLSTTTSALTDVMTAYHMPLSAAAGATDVLFNSSRIANIGVDSIATAVSRMHSRIGDATPSLAVTGGLLVDLSDHGLTGSRGLLQVTSSMMALEKGGKPVDALLKTMGASLTDAAGKTLPLTSVIAELQPKLLAMAPAQRNAAMQTLFGATASDAFKKIIMEGAPALQAHIDTVSKVGSAHAGAMTATDTLAGSEKKLKATFDDAMVTIGTKMLPVISSLATKDMPLLISATGWLSDHLGTIVPILGGIVGLFVAWKIALAAHAVIMGIVTIAQGAWTVATGIASVAMGVFNAVMDANPIALIIIAIAALIAIVILIATHFTAFTNIVVGVWNWLGNFKLILMILLGPIGLVIGLVVLLATHFDTVRNVIGNVWNTMSGFASFIGGAFAGAWNGIVSGAQNAWNGLLNFAGDIFNKIKNAILSPFQNLHIPLPHFNVSSQHIGVGPAAVDIPKVDIQWYAKGGIFDKPTMLGGGAGVGDAGPEAAAPISELQKYMPDNSPKIIEAIHELTRVVTDGRDHTGGNLDKNGLLRALGSLMADYNYANSRGLMRPV